jgi:DNA repair protein SbcC/Rad50
MIPIRLTLQGLYSYQEKQIIDFTRLTQSHIFGIFGPVGSGKSAILEAISYALYGRTDRMNLSGDNRYYNMMNLKSNELLIEFIFTAGKQDTEYLTVVKSRRNSRQYEDVKAIEHIAYKKTNHEWTPVAVSSLESVIGLSYENFKRTIIIPQGKFQEFLQLGNKERTQMMKELFNLDKYELYFKVLSLETKNSNQIQNLEGRLKQLGEISLSQVEEHGKNLAILKKEIETKQQELAFRQGQEMEFRKLGDLFRRIKETENSLIQIKNQEPLINRLEKTIREYEYCQLNFKGLFESSEENSRKIVQFRRSMDEDDKTLAKTVLDLSECKLYFDAAKTEFEEREKYNRQAGELLKIAKLNELRESAGKLTASMRHSEKVLQETLEGINKLRLLQEELKENIQNWKLQNPDMSLLSDVREWYAIKKQLESAKKETETEIITVNDEIEEIRKMSLHLWQEECFSGIPESNDLLKTWELLDNKKKGLQVLKDRLGIETEHLTLQARLEEYAANLAEGKPCPLCGSLSHPLPLDSRNVKETLRLTRQKSVDCDKLIDGIELSQKKVRETESRVQAKKDVLEKLRRKLVEQNAKTSLHEGQFKWDTYREESELRTAYSLAEKIRLQINQGEDQLENISKQLEENGRLRENNLHTIDEAKLQLNSNNTESVILRQQIEILNTGEYVNHSVNEIKFKREDLLKKYRDAEINFAQVSERLKDLQKNHDNVSGRLQANREALAGELKSQAKLNDRIVKQLALSGFSSANEIRNILSQEQNIENDKKKVTDFRQSIAVATRQLSSLQSETAEKHYDEDIHRELANQISVASAELTEKNQQQGKLEGELNKMKTDFLAYTEMNDQMAALAARGEDIKTLKQLFKASGFVNYISTVYLQELCHAANERFYKLTRQKFSLEVTDDNNFQVRDFLNGGKVRNVKTLSGGQTFQAALSLSLALADSIQKITESNQNFFFLDEGFGSLDKESLAIVFDTLKSLRRENRIVGVISHVEEMQQEIDNYLKIVLDEERGSIIRNEPYGK